MPSSKAPDTTLASRSYAALRHGGAPPWSARVQLGLEPAVAARLEGLFQGRRGGGSDDAMRPRFARHRDHVTEVMRLGGFPALCERRR